MAITDKDTIYIDVDDEITAVIDKVKASKSKVIALVLPKRATVFQSIVNMKLLKKAVDGSKKNVVLITSEAGLLPLAGAAGVFVAKTLTSKPEIPKPPEEYLDDEDIEHNEAEAMPDEADNLDATQPVGALAEPETATKGALAKDGVETVALDNTLDDAKDKELDADKKPKGEKKDKKLKVPNFERFRKYLLIAAGVIILLLILFLLLGSSFDKATINVSTNASNVNANLNLNLATDASSVDTSSSTVPAKLATEQKTYSATVGTTGQTNNGNKASGTIQVSTNSCSIPNDIPAGSAVTSNNLTFLTQDDITFQSTNPSGHQKCEFQGTDASSGQNSIPIIAQSPGTSYNNANNFSLPGQQNLNVSVASTITGGTDNVVQTVNQNDINSAKTKISTNSSGVKSDLTNQLNGDGYYPILATFNTGTPNTTNSANVGAVANNVTVTETITYTLFGVHKSDLQTLVTNSVDGQINTSQQSILDYGINNAVYNVNSQTSTAAQLSMSAVVEVGPQLSIASIKSSAEGQKTGAIESQLKTNPNVTGVKVSISPFWASTVPKDASKITVNIAKPSAAK